MNDVTILVVDLTFLRREDGGKVQLPGPPFLRYSPHLVVQMPDIRQAIMEENNIVEDYVPVEFLDGPLDYVAGETGRFQIAIVHAIKTSCESLHPGATFTVREGSRIIGFGTVVERKEHH
jgi:hypothetical protein